MMGNTLFLLLLLTGLLLVLAAEWWGWLVLLVGTAVFGLLTGSQLFGAAEAAGLAGIAGLTIAGSLLLKRAAGETGKDLSARTAAGFATLLLFSLFFGPTAGAISWWSLIGRRLVKQIRGNKRVLVYPLAAFFWRFLGGAAFSALAVSRLVLPGGV